MLLLLYTQPESSSVEGVGFHGVSIEFEHIFMHLGYFNMNGFILEGVYIRNPLPNMPMFM